MKELLIDLDSSDKLPLYEQIYRFVKREIHSGKIREGEGLPSSRALSRQLGVSRSTVDLAYEQLVSEGYLESVPCKGYYVCGMEGVFELEPIRGSRTAVRKKEETEYIYDFAVNGIDPGGFPHNIWRKLSRAVLNGDESELFGLGDSKGEWELREAIAGYLHHARGVNAKPGQIVVGAGNDYLLMLLSVLFSGPVKIAMENPTYKSAWNCFACLGHELHAVPMDAYGMKPEELERSGARLAYVMPSHQFPMGMVMPMRRRMQILSWAGAAGDRYIIEDDYDSEFRYKGRPIPALQGFDKNGRVIYLGTFSKAVAPAIRISYMVLPESLLETYERKGRTFSATVSRVDQKIIGAFLREGHFERHLNRMRALYKGKHDLMLRLLKSMGDICWFSGENAGVHLLVYLRYMREEEAVRRAAKAGVKVYPLSGYLTGPGQSGREAVLLGYATMSEEEIVRAMEILNNVWRN